MELKVIQNRIHEIRGYQVMMDYDLAEMYQVETKVLKQAVRRNISRFPPDFMFEISKREWKDQRSQIVTFDRLGIKYLPFAFTEQGVAMLSSVLRSEKAIEVNIQIIRVFIQLRQSSSLFAEINQKLESFMTETNIQFNEIYLALQELAERKAIPRKAIGYLADPK